MTYNVFSGTLNPTHSLTHGIGHNIQGQTSNVASYHACSDGLNETMDILDE